MKPLKLRKREGPEANIQRAFSTFLKTRGWMVERMVGNALQYGIPDLYIAHTAYGRRWVDLKNPGKYEFTKAQRIKWPQWESHGVGIWIITAATEVEYQKLFTFPNFRDYWKTKYDTEKTVEELLDEIE